SYYATLATPPSPNTHSFPTRRSSDLTQIEEQDRGVYDVKNEFKYKSKTEKGLTEEIVTQISKEKNEPDWMLEIRLASLKKFYELDRKSTRLNSSHVSISYAVFCLKKN